MQHDSPPCWTIDYSNQPVMPLVIDGFIEVVNKSGDLEYTGGNEVRAYLLHAHGNYSTASRASQSQSCRWLLQQLLQVLHPTDSGNWAVNYSNQGAPLLQYQGRPSRYHLSFSHSGQHFALALGQGIPLAVDIERCGSGRNFAALGSYLGWNPDDTTEDSFLARWTLWEACAKVSSKSILSQSIEGFDQLSSQMQLQQLIQVESWYALQLKVLDHAFVSFVMHQSESPALTCQRYDLPSRFSASGIESSQCAELA